MASRGVNKVILVGNVGMILRFGICQTGNAVANISIATRTAGKIEILENSRSELSGTELFFLIG